MLSVPPQLISSISAGITYSLKGWFGNKKETDEKLKNFNLTLFTKNLVIGTALGLIAYFLYPDMPIEQVAQTYPLFFVLQSFVDKLWYKLFG